MQAGLEGEKKEVYTEEGCKKVKWEKDGGRKPLTWYKVYIYITQENVAKL